MISQYDNIVNVLGIIFSKFGDEESKMIFNQKLLYLINQNGQIFFEKMIARSAYWGEIKESLIEAQSPFLSRLKDCRKIVYFGASSSGHKARKERISLQVLT